MTYSCELSQFLSQSDVLRGKEKKLDIFVLHTLCQSAWISVAERSKKKKGDTSASNYQLLIRHQ